MPIGSCITSLSAPANGPFVMFGGSTTGSGIESGVNFWLRTISATNYSTYVLTGFFEKWNGTAYVATTEDSFYDVIAYTKTGGSIVTGIHDPVGSDPNTRTGYFANTTGKQISRLALKVNNVVFNPSVNLSAFIWLTSPLIYLPSTFNWDYLPGGGIWVENGGSYWASTPRGGDFAQNYSFTPTSPDTYLNEWFNYKVYSYNEIAPNLGKYKPWVNFCFAGTSAHTSNIGSVYGVSKTTKILELDVEDQIIQNTGKSYAAIYLKTRFENDGPYAYDPVFWRYTDSRCEITKIDRYRIRNSVLKLSNICHSFNSSAVLWWS